MTRVVTAKGWQGTISFDGAIVTVERSGLLALSAFGRTHKRIPIGSIQAVQWHPFTGVSMGFIQFTLAGGIEQNSGADAPPARLPATRTL